jgi:hypothetical protein
LLSDDSAICQCQMKVIVIENSYFDYKFINRELKVVKCNAGNRENWNGWVWKKKERKVYEG